MANYTSNYNLTKPLPSDLYNIGVQNANMDKIDQAIADIDKNVRDHEHSLADGKIKGVLPIEKGGTGADNPTQVRTNIGAAPINHNHSLADGNISGVLPIKKGGTGANDVPGVRKALGLGETSGAVPVANGGTGADNAADARRNLDVTPANIGAVAESEHYGAIKKTDKVCVANCYAGTGIHVTTEILPNQAGSGAPYPAGGGKNLLPFMMKGNTFSANGMTGEVTDEGLVVNGTPSSAYVSLLNSDIVLPAGTYTVHGGTASGGLYTQINVTRADGTTNTYSNGTFDIYGDEQRIRVFVQCSSALVTMTNYVVQAQLERGSVATDFQLYENIRPIIGYDAVELHHAGKNLMPVLSGSESNSDGIEWKNNRDGSWTANGTATAAAYIAGGGKAFGLGVLPAGEYKLSIIASSEETGKVYLRIGSGQDAAFLTSNDSQSKDKECTFVADGVTEYYAAIAIKSGETVKDYRIFPVLAKSSYSIFSVNIGQIVYGGKMDWLTGKLVSEWMLAKGVFTRAALDSSGKLYAVAGIPSTAKPYTTTKEEGEPNIVCTALPFRALEDARKYGEVCISQYGTGIYIGGFVGREAELDALIASDDFAVAYKLATPIEIQFDPIGVIEALDGVNTVYCNTGECTVEFGHAPKFNVIYSAEQPEYQAGAIWLKPID